MRLASRIINETIVPLFKEGDFAGGINAGVDQMLKVVDGEPLPAPDKRWKSNNGMDRLLKFLGFALVVATFLRNFIGRAPAAPVRALGSAGMAWWLHSPLIAVGFIGARNVLRRAAHRLRGLEVSGAAGRGGRVFRDISRGGGFGGGWRWRIRRRWRWMEWWRWQGRRRRRVRPLVVSPWTSREC